MWFLPFFLNVPFHKGCDELTGEDLDRRNFVDLLVKMLQLDPEERIRPSQILQHPFITMSHLATSTTANSKKLSSVVVEGGLLTQNVNVF